MKKGIMKKAGLGSSSGRRARWNEDNLEANELIKTELNPSKIDEPKTPYHSPLDIDVGNIALNGWNCGVCIALLADQICL